MFPVCCYLKHPNNIFQIEQLCVKHKVVTNLPSAVFAKDPVPAGWTPFGCTNDALVVYFHCPFVASSSLEKWFVTNGQRQSGRSRGFLQGRSHEQFEAASCDWYIRPQCVDHNLVRLCRSRLSLLLYDAFSNPKGTRFAARRTDSKNPLRLQDNFDTREFRKLLLLTRDGHLFHVLIKSISTQRVIVDGKAGFPRSLRPQQQQQQQQQIGAWEVDF